MLSETIRFSNGRHAKLVRASRYEDLSGAFRSLGLEAGCPVLVFITGAASVEEKDLEVIQQTADRIARVAERIGAAIIDGGTQAGGMEAMGASCARRGYSFPLIGVAAEGTVSLPDTPLGEDQWILDPNHNFFILSPGDQWGQETPWISETATQLAGKAPSITVLTNGGAIARNDIATSLAAKRPVYVLKGTGRLADELAEDPQYNEMVKIIPAQDGEELEDALMQALSPKL